MPQTDFGHNLQRLAMTNRPMERTTLKTNWQDDMVKKNWRVFKVACDKEVIAISLRSDSSRVLHGTSAEKDKF